MAEIIRFFPLRLISHSDRTAVLSAYSRERGRVAFAVSPSSRRRSLFTPLNLLEGVASSRPGRELLTLREPRELMPLHTVMSSPARGAVLLFAAEVAERTLGEPQPDRAIFSLLEHFVVAANDPRKPPANLPLCLLVQLITGMGVMPDTEGYRPGMLLDLRDGLLRATPPLHGLYANAADTLAAVRLLRMSWANYHIYRYNHTQRQQLLRAALDYLSAHAADLSSLRSLSVLIEIFA